jgi:formylglycine-generating enzyme
MKSPLNTTLGLALALGIFANPAMAAIVLDFVPVGDTTNTGHSIPGGTFGAVSTQFHIGKYEVTVSQYAAFLNAVAKTDTYTLYSENMDSSVTAGGITRTGTSGNFVYNVKLGMGNMPITFVSWLDAARFANWMHNGQPTGAQSNLTTETGAYTLNGTTTGPGTITRNPGATVWLPSENEWYKAAYYDPNRNGPGSAGYWPYATQSAALVGNTFNTADSANYTILGNGPTSPIRITPVGEYGVNSTSAYGTYDQTGNVREYTDTISSGSSRITRGGAWDISNLTALSNSVRPSSSPTVESAQVGFRVAVIPEPSTALFSILAVGASLLRRNRRSH